ASAAATRVAGLPARTPHTEPQPLDNSWTPFSGDPFFLLTDATYGSDEVAKARIEVNSPASLAQTGGVDVRLYRIPDPLAFLQRQKNLHRVQVDAPAAEPGAANTLTHLWDSWSVKARLAWQKLFSADARGAVVAQAPALKTPPALRAPSTFEEPTQYRPIPGLKMLDHFRYPVQYASPIGLPQDLALAGSSSNFIEPDAGNVFVPLGKRPPGLYLVEAIAGSYRATTLLFVSDSVALTKVSGDQMLVWSAGRRDGAPVPGTRVVWTDGLGALKTGTTDATGAVAFDRHSPEQSDVFGLDPKGGVFVTENFYYDSEVYAAKVYAVTDRPLYRPGDTVNVHVTGREFRSARESVALKDGDMTLSVVDPTGQTIVHQSVPFSGTQGADARFALPDGAPGGGYELRMTLDGDPYTAAFRVSEYQKPHFEIGVVPDKADFKTGEAVTGKLQLTYPDGKPVAHARVSLTGRAQKLTMTEGELDYGGQFPLKLSQAELDTDGDGIARFTLPAADQPSRYVITALATDGAAYRVRASRELLVERGGASWHLAPDRQFSKPGEAVTYRLSAARLSTALPVTGTSPDAALAANAPARPATWEWVRLENRAKASGTLAAGDRFSIAYPQPGSYTLTLRDERGRIVAAASHWVSGDGLKAPAGTVGIVFDRAQYHAGDVAEALVSFPEPVDHALLTLERDRVEATALLGGAADWERSERLGPTQWRVRVPVREDMSPNVTFSVAYVKNGDYVFQNQGLLVEQPRIALAFSTPKAVYAPGERVDVDVSATLAGKPVVADVNVGVVDEMIYVLQPEIAPRIEDFFFHPRRDNVRTSASLSFIGYDLATSRLGDVPTASQVNQRAVKVLERPRRDDVDTAAWVPRLTTDSSGHARFSFTMPDSLTRWRVTGRAIDAAGDVGQQVAWVRSDKPFYAKWTSPAWQREGDQAVAALALFNQTGAEAGVEWSAQGPGLDRHGRATLRPGVNFVDVPLAADHPGALPLTLTIRRD
ncbi:MAG TPA: MG2 domain-containing protein, partial [Burkholderiaceae bacterium]